MNYKYTTRGSEFMKKLMITLLASAIVLSVAGCSNNKPESVSSLTLMEEINDKNVFHSDPNARLWYQVNAEYFADSNQDGKGDLQGLIQWLPYFSDSDPADTDEDLNMTGLYLNDIISVDSSGSVLDYYQFQSGIGTPDDLKELCSRAVNYDIPVMINLDLSSCSVKNPDFEALVKEAESLGKDATLEQLSSDNASMFSITDEQANSNWIQLGTSPFYYLGFNGTEAPNYSQDSEAFRQKVRSIIEYYTSLGVQGFYIDNINDFYSNSDEKNAEFSSWLASTISEINPVACVVFNTGDLKPEFSDIDGWIAQSRNAGVEGGLAKAATGTITAKQLGDLLRNGQEHITYPASYINTQENTLDLLKSAKKASTFKMLMALQILSSGQIFIMAGDEIGLPSNEYDLVSEALDPEYRTASQDDSQARKDQPADEEIQDTMTFGSFSEQKEDGNSVLNFVLQAIRLRDAYDAISSGKIEVLDQMTSDQVLALRKKVENSEVAVLFNLSDSEQKVNLSDLKLSGLPPEIGGVLLSGEEQIQLENDTLLLPAQSVCVLK